MAEDKDHGAHRRPYVVLEEVDLGELVVRLLSNAGIGDEISQDGLDELAGAVVHRKVATVIARNSEHAHRQGGKDQSVPAGTPVLIAVPERNWTETPEGFRVYDRRGVSVG